MTERMVWAKRNESSLMTDLNHKLFNIEVGKMILK